MTLPASAAAMHSQQQPARLEAVKEPGLAQARADLAEVREENSRLLDLLAKVCHSSNPRRDFHADLLL